MKIFYKYIFCLLVYVIPFASTSPFAPFTGEQTSLLYGEYLASFDKELFFGNDNSSDIRKAIIEQTEGSEAKPMSIPKWDHASFDDVLQEVVPLILSINDSTKSINEGYINIKVTEHINVKNEISEAMMRIANGESEGGGHIAVARVIFDDGKVIPLPYFFLSGIKGKSIAKLNIGVRVNKDYFRDISMMGVSCDPANALLFAHSERAIGLYLQNKLQNDLKKLGYGPEYDLSKIRVIQIKNASPMCHNCELFWENEAHYCMLKRIEVERDNDGNIKKEYSSFPPSQEFCAQDVGAAYNVWAGVPSYSVLCCSNYKGNKKQISSKGLECFEKTWDNALSSGFVIPEVEKRIEKAKKRKNK